LTHEDIAQAGFIFVMESARIVCPDIPDRYAFMAPELVALLKRKVAPRLPELQRALRTPPFRGRRQA